MAKHSNITHHSFWDVAPMFCAQYSPAWHQPLLKIPPPQFLLPNPFGPGYGSPYDEDIRANRGIAMNSST